MLVLPVPHVMQLKSRLGVKIAVVVMYLVGGLYVHLSFPPVLPSSLASGLSLSPV
jgi:uncharacterized membrane protein YjjP (DUF1212 family)